MTRLQTGNTDTPNTYQRSVPLRAATLAAAGVLLAASLPALAQKTPTERIDELERKLEQSLKQIEQLSQEVARLRGAAPQAAAAPGSAAPAAEQVTQQAAKIEDLERQVAQINDANAARRAQARRAAAARLRGH